MTSRAAICLLLLALCGVHSGQGQQPMPLEIDVAQYLDVQVDLGPAAAAPAPALRAGQAPARAAEAPGAEDRPERAPLQPERAPPAPPLGVDVFNVQNRGLSGSLPVPLPGSSQFTKYLWGHNDFNGTLPPSWSSDVAEYIDLSYNKLTGDFPVSWWTNFPSLKSLYLNSNGLGGPVDTSSRKQPATVRIRPGNEGLCGNILPANPSQWPEYLGPIAGPVPPPFQAPGTTSVQFVHVGMFGASNVTVTNTLGSCTAKPGTCRPQAVPAPTNLYDLTWTYNVSLADLKAANPGLGRAHRADAHSLVQHGPEPAAEAASDAAGAPRVKGDGLLELPCYLPGQVPTYFGGDAAYAQFAGGYQLADDGGAGMQDAELAGGVVRHIPSQGIGSNFAPYTKKRASDGLQSPDPIYWFVDLRVEFQVSAVVITAGPAATALTVNCILTNDATTSAATSPEPKQGSVDLAARQTRAVAFPTAGGTRYLVLVPGDFNKDIVFSLDSVQVYPREANAALGKSVYTSLTTVDNLHVLDGNMETCTLYEKGSDGTVWFVVDLGYMGQVTAVAATMLTLEMPGTVEATVYVSESRLGGGGDVSAPSCGDPLVLGDIVNAAIPCNLTGRYVMLLAALAPGIPSLQFCDFEVFLGGRPWDPADDSSGSLSSGAIAGIAVGAVVGALLLGFLGLMCVMYLRWRRRRLRDEAGPQGDADVEKSGGESGSYGYEGGQLRSPQPSNEIALLSEFVSKWRRSRLSSSKWGGAARTDTPDSLQKPSADGSLAEGIEMVEVALPDKWITVNYKELELVKVIGEGSFGQVWLAKWCQTTVACKLLQPIRGGPGQSLAGTLAQPELLKELQKEAAIMAALRHPNVVQYLGACLTPPCLIMEHCSKRSIDVILNTALRDPKLAKQLSWVRLLSMAFDSAKGLLFLHTRSPPIIHRDFKSANVLVDGQWHAKVADFNMSRALEEQGVLSTLCVTNPRWLAPELLRGLQATLASDVYAVAVVMWELTSWKLPWGDNTNPFQIINSVQNEGASLPVLAPGELPAGPFSGYAAYVELMQQCWAREPGQRPGMAEVTERLKALLHEEVLVVQALAGGAAAAATPVSPAPGSQ